MNHIRTLGRLLAVLILTATVGALAPPSIADVPVDTPVEGYPRYEPQTACKPRAKVGTRVLAAWIVTRYGGRSAGISRSCAGGSTSEHKEGRAFDWALDARSAADRARASRLLKALFATGPSGEPAELARRMGVMYVIWNDQMYASYERYQPKRYRSSSCRRLRTCSPTLRHRDHMHISLTRAAGRARTSWFAGRRG